MKITIRQEAPNDIRAIRQINLAAFDQDGEGKRGDALRDAGDVHVYYERPFNKL